MFGPLRAGAGGAGYSGRYKQGGCSFARYRAEKRGVGTWGSVRDPDVVGGQVCFLDRGCLDGIEGCLDVGGWFAVCVTWCGRWGERCPFGQICGTRA